jgi:hypothetical protein
MQMPITLGGITRDRITAYGTPTFCLREVKSITGGPGGQMFIDYTDVNMTFGLTEWNKVVESGGNLSVLGVQIKTFPKIPGFDQHWQGG